jgi:hypothetical protein
VATSGFFADKLEVNKDAMRVLLLEAVAFGTFLWDEETKTIDSFTDE